MGKAISICVSFSILLAASSASAQTCDMSRIAEHKDRNRTAIYASRSGVPSLYYHANMDVNTDGSPRSYHPEDPRGQRLAFNNMGNAIVNIYDRSGRKVTCKPRRGACFTSFISTFEASRDAGYNPAGHPRFTTDGIIPWKRDEALGYRTPCLIQDGAFKGYFVSQTSIAVDPGAAECDQARYLDSFSFNAVVLPRKVMWSSMGVRTDDGDLVVVRDRASGRIAFAINGDRGPEEGIGEGTIALTAKLKAKSLRGDEPYSEILGLVVRDVDYLTFPADDIRRKVGAGRKFTQADIDRYGKEIFEKWGGLGRLEACISTH